MVRFEGGTGIVRAPDATAVLVLAPSTSTSFRNSPPWSNFRADLESDPIRYVRKVASYPPVGGALGALTLANRQKLLGDLSSDTVLAKPVGQLAVCYEKRLAQALGARLDNATGSLYKNPATTSPPWEPQFVDIAGAPFTDIKLQNLNDWVEGHLRVGTQDVESDCRVFVVQRHLGWLQEISGTTGGQGVGQ
jgi:hypothetical protein